MSAKTSHDAVSVVIPAHDAQATLDETLRSVRSQTHRALEILVVDDGSRDRTPDIALDHAARDPRVRLIRQPNGGVAQARNRGIAEATCALVAPVDADDLWAPTKIERQLEALHRGGPRVALVYTWTVLLDAGSHVIGYGDRPQDEGDVLARMCRGNLVGNGSAALMRRDAVLAAGGYDTSLREMQAQGCEDLLLYSRIVAQHHAAVVPDFLTGYRQGVGTMSRDLPRMMRSWRLVAAEMRERHPHLIGDIDWGEVFAARWLAGRALRAGRLREALAIARRPAGGGIGLPKSILFVEAARAVSQVAERRIRRLVCWGQRHHLPQRRRFVIGTCDQDGVA